MYLSDLANSTELLSDTRWRAEFLQRPRYPRKCTAAWPPRRRWVRLSTTAGAAITGHPGLRPVEGRLDDCSRCALACGRCIVRPNAPAIGIPGLVLLCTNLYGGVRTYHKRHCGGSSVMPAQDHSLAVGGMPA